MKKICFLILMLIACDTIGIDGTPPWDVADRLGLEMVNDCNLTKHSIGLSGCSFHINDIGGNLTLPSLWSGTIGLTSYSCKSITAIANSSADNIFAVKDLYTANGHSCSFELTRNLREGDLVSDNTLKGRFFIKILPVKGYSNLRFNVGQNSFNGVGWYQRKYQTEDAVLVIKPRSSSGMFTITCSKNNEDPAIVYRNEYTTSPFEVKLDSIDSCDYEMVAVNYESTGEDNEVESATYVHHVVENYTRDISIPYVTVRNNKVSFTFTDKDVDGRLPIIAGVQVNNTKFIKAHIGTMPISQSFIVKAITPSLRFFYGKYDYMNHKWYVE